MPRTAKKTAAPSRPTSRPRLRNVVSIQAAEHRAAEKRLRAFVADLPAEFLECRQYNHAWTGYTVESGRKQYTVTLRCLRCKSFAREVLAQDGSREGTRTIQYVEGYLAHGMGRMTGEARSALRLEGVHRHVG